MYLIITIISVCVVFSNTFSFAQSYTPPFGDEFFVDLPTNWTVPITLHPGPTVVLGGTTKVAFAVPIPRKGATSLSQIIITDSLDQELATDVQEIATWNSLSGDASVSSIRSVLVFVDVVFNDTLPINYIVKYGTNRNLELGTQPSVQSTWTDITNNTYPDEYPAYEAIMEPQVYVTFPPEWLGACLLRTRSKPLYTVTQLAFKDDFYLNSSYTAVNLVDTSVTSNELVDYIDSIGIGPDNGTDGYAPWLFDRAMTLFGIYFQTGDVKWLRHAHRASQFYSQHLLNGYFDLKLCWDDSDPCDLKYSYGKSMFTDLMLTGDTTHLSKIQEVYDVGITWNETYNFVAGSTSFWTERHQAYALLAALSSWEATGSSIHAARVQEIVDASFDHALNPPNGWTANGSLMTTWNAHEGWNGDDPLASPWMHALLDDAIMQYYIHSEDNDALIFMSNLGDYIENVATYEDQLHTNWGRTYIFPYYLASEVVQHRANGGWDDLEHALDIAAITNKAAWAKGILGLSNSSMISLTDELLETGEFRLDYWHRPGSDTNYGKPPWRLAPPRKYNWWFGSTMDIGALEIISTPLAIELLQFNVQLSQSKKTVRLDWKTASEVNNKGFGIQKKNTFGEWSMIGWVDGNNNSTNLSKYTFIDKQPMEGFNYYRLKQIDYDGQYEYSPTKSINYKKAKSSISIYPNPSSHNINLGEHNYSIYKIYNNIGQVIISGKITNNIDISGLSNGTYTIKLLNDYESDQVMFVKN